jgi:hypothetical protein
MTTVDGGAAASEGWVCACAAGVSATMAQAMACSGQEEDDIGDMESVARNGSMRSDPHSRVQGRR